MMRVRRTTRVVVIDRTKGGEGRILDKWLGDGSRFVISQELQDDDRTLKIYIEEEQK